MVIFGNRVLFIQEKNLASDLLVQFLTKHFDRKLPCFYTIMLTLVKSHLLVHFVTKHLDSKLPCFDTNALTKVTNYLLVHFVTKYLELNLICRTIFELIQEKNLSSV